MAEPHHVLFLCTGNSARSILAEAYLNARGKDRFKAFSAGSHPSGIVNPFALQLLAEQQIDAEALRSKSWDEFAASRGAKFDVVITVCDNAAGEACPVWPGQPLTVHWGVADPAAVQGGNAEKREAFVKAFNELSARIGRLLELSLEKLPRQELKAKLDAIGTS